MRTMTLPKEELRGRIFTVYFRKRTDGRFRKMRCRLGVSKYINGNGLRFDPNSRGLQVVFDLQKKAYRMIDLNTIYRIKANGKDTYFKRVKSGDYILVERRV